VTITEQTVNKIKRKIKREDAQTETKEEEEGAAVSETSEPVFDKDGQKQAKNLNGPLNSRIVSPGLSLDKEYTVEKGNGSSQKNKTGGVKQERKELVEIHQESPRYEKTKFKTRFGGLKRQELIPSATGVQ